MVEPEAEFRLFHYSCTSEPRSKELKEGAKSRFYEPWWSFPSRGLLAVKWPGFLGALLGTDLSLSRCCQLHIPKHVLLGTHIHLLDCTGNVHWVLANKPGYCTERTFFFGIEKYNEFHIFSPEMRGLLSIHDLHFVLISPWIPSCPYLPVVFVMKTNRRST